MELAVEEPNSCSESSSGLFSLPSPWFPRSAKWGWFVAQHAAFSLSLTHAHMHALRGCTGGEQVGESKSPPNGQILFICSSWVSTHTEELSCCSQLITWWIMQHVLFMFCRWMSWFGTFLRAEVGFCCHPLTSVEAENCTCAVARKVDVGPVKILSLI